MEAIEALRAWLNGKRDYMQGVMLYNVHGSDVRLQALFAKGPTDFTRQKIYSSLLEIFNSWKEKYEAAAATNAAVPVGQDASVTEPSAEPPVAPIKNAALEAAADEESSKLWKLMMHRRAELFAMVRRIPGHDDVNKPEYVEQRTPICFEVHQLARQADAAYDKLAYVREHGRLPTDEIEIAQENAYVPDHDLKHTIDNLRKNINKLRKREQTAARVDLLTKHESSLEKLLTRWHSLKQKI